MLQKPKASNFKPKKGYWEFSIHLGRAMIFFLSFLGSTVISAKVLMTLDTHPIDLRVVANADIFVLA
jgi:hypothetical protein